MTPLRFKFFIAAVAAQFLVLLWIYISTLVPLWFGEEVRLQVEGADPRSLFRGNYARLRYLILDEENINLAAAGCSNECMDIEAMRKLNKNEIVYVRLANCNTGLCENGGVVRERPNKGLYLKGRWRGKYWRNEDLILLPTVNAWFAPKEEALHIESHYNRDNPEKLVMTLRVLPDSGKAATVYMESTTGKIYGDKI